MASALEDWNDRALDQLDGRVENTERDIDRIDSRFAEIDAELRKRPTWSQVKDRIDSRGASATRGQIIVAAIGAAAIVIAAAIAAVAQIESTTPLPIK